MHQAESDYVSVEEPSVKRRDTALEAAKIARKRCRGKEDFRVLQNPALNDGLLQLVGLLSRLRCPNVF